MIRAQRGTALAVTLILLTGLGTLALAAAAAAMSALALTGHAQDVLLATEAAEAAINAALARAADERGPGASGERDWPVGNGPQAIIQARTDATLDPGTLPEGFSLGESPDSFSARHYYVVADARAGRAAAVRLEQGFYLVVPAP